MDVLISVKGNLFHAIQEDPLRLFRLHFSLLSLLLGQLRHRRRFFYRKELSQHFPPFPGLLMQEFHKFPLRQEDNLEEFIRLKADEGEEFLVYLGFFEQGIGFFPGDDLP